MYVRNSAWAQVPAWDSPPVIDRRNVRGEDQTHIDIGHWPEMNYTPAWLLLLHWNTRNTFPQQGILNQLLIHQIPNRKWKEQQCSLNLPHPKIQLAHSAVFAHAWQNQSRPDFLCSPVFFQIFLPVLRSSALVVAVLTMSLILLFCPLLTPGDFQYLRPLLKQLLMRARVLSSDCWHHSAISGHKQKTRRPRESAQ